MTRRVHSTIPSLLFFFSFFTSSFMGTNKCRNSYLAVDSSRFRRMNHSIVLDGRGGSVMRSCLTTYLELATDHNQAGVLSQEYIWLPRNITGL